MEGNLYWGERKTDRKMMHISDVLNGEQCNCLCPACGSPLLARQGSVNAWHFAHMSEHPCTQGAETALHRLAKEIIAAGTSIRLPDGRRFDYTNVSLEKPLQGIRPDACLGNGIEWLLIEVFVSSRVTPRKEQLICSLGLSAVEIDISWIRREISKAELCIHILEQVENKRMLAVVDADSNAGKDGANDFPYWIMALLGTILLVLIAIVKRNKRSQFRRYNW